MIPWKLLDTAKVPGSRSELRLFQREDEFSIEVDGEELMNSRVSCSEDGLSELGCARISGRSQPRVLIGGLGMGFTLKAALDRLPEDAEVVIAEIVPEVVKWNRALLGHLARHPLNDARVKLREMDVARVVRDARASFDLMLLDVDNGPEGLTRKANDWLYSSEGLAAARRALRPNGVLGFWSSGPNEEFVHRMEESGYDVEETAIDAAAGAYGISHTIWLGSPRI
jgi:spermidine synthase